MLSDFCSAAYIKKIHEKTKVELEKKAKYFAAKANKNWKKVIYLNQEI
jgi:hypothetical protein